MGTIFADVTGFPTKTRVVLVDQVDWCDGDQLDETYFIPASHEGIVRDGYPTPETDADALLSAFGIWRDVNLATIAKNDVAHLFTGRDLTANSVGGAYQYSACSDDSSYCGATNPEDPSKTLRSGDCAFDSSVGASGATVCCNGRRGGAVSTVADPSNANTDETGYEATSLVFESALIVSHHLGKQLGMDIDGTGNSVNCSATGYVMADRTDDDRYRPEAAGKFSQFSRCSAATLERQLPTYTCLFRETVGRSICGNGVVERERGEECDCGGGDSDGVCAIAVRLVRRRRVLQRDDVSFHRGDHRERGAAACAVPAARDVRAARVVRRRVRRGSRKRGFRVRDGRPLEQVSAVYRELPGGGLLHGHGSFHRVEG